MRTLEAAGWKLEPFPRDLEREERARRILEEGVDLGEPGKAGVGLARAAVERNPGLGLGQEGFDIGGGKPLDPEQVTVWEMSGHQSRALGGPGLKLKRKRKRPIPPPGERGTQAEGAPAIASASIAPWRM